METDLKQFLSEMISSDLEVARKDRHLLSEGFQKNSTNSDGSMLDDAKE